MENSPEGIMAAIVSNLPAAEARFVQQAYEVARTAHAGQQRASGVPFIIHPVAVAHNLAQLQSDSQALAAALLHDVVEDTPVTIWQLAQEFGRDVARLVDGVTLNGGSDDDRQKLAHAIVEDRRVGLIRLADRLDNMRTLAALPRPRQIRMAQETKSLYVPLAHLFGLADWRDELRQLALDYLITPPEGVPADWQLQPAPGDITSPGFFQGGDSSQWSEQVLSLFSL